MCMHVCMCVGACVCVSLCACVCVCHCVHGCMHACVRTCMHACTACSLSCYICHCSELQIARYKDVFAAALITDWLVIHVSLCTYTTHSVAQ